MTKEQTSQVPPTKNSEDELVKKGKALANSLLFQENPWEFFKNPARVIKRVYPEYKKNENAKSEIRHYAMKELEGKRGKVVFNSAIQRTDYVLRITNRMHIATFIIGNVLLFVAVVMLCLHFFGVVSRKKPPGNPTAQATPISVGQPPANKGELALFIIFGTAGAAGVGLNLLYFLWASPATRIRKALSDTAQLEMAYNTYTLGVQNLEKLDTLIKEYKTEGGKEEKKEEILKTIKDTQTRFGVKGDLLSFTKALVNLIECTAEPPEEKIPQIENIMENLKSVLLKETKEIKDALSKKSPNTSQDKPGGSS